MLRTNHPHLCCGHAFPEISRNFPHICGSRLAYCVATFPLFSQICRCVIPTLRSTTKGCLYGNGGEQSESYKFAVSDEGGRPTCGKRQEQSFHNGEVGRLCHTKLVSSRQADVAPQTTHRNRVAGPQRRWAQGPGGWGLGAAARARYWLAPRQGCWVWVGADQTGNTTQRRGGGMRRPSAETSEGTQELYGVPKCLPLGFQKLPPGGAYNSTRVPLSG